jgi:hypothetical protein
MLTREQEIEIIVRGLRDRQPGESDEDIAGRIIDDFARTNTDLNAHVRLAASDFDALVAAARAVDAAWDEPDPDDPDALEGNIWLSGDEGDVEPYTPNVPDMVAALRTLRAKLSSVHLKPWSDEWR